MTFKEQREAERIAETANIGPGSNTGHIKEFGADVHMKVNFGNKYEFKPDNNPPPGKYDVDAAMKLTKPKAYEAIFLSYKKQEGLKPGEQGPDPGIYQKETIVFGKDVKGNIDMGKKYVTKYNNNPPPGLYAVEAADALTKPKTRAA